MDCKTDKKRHSKERHCLGNEDKQNGSMEDRAKLQKAWWRKP